MKEKIETNTRVGRLRRSPCQPIQRGLAGSWPVTLARGGQQPKLLAQPCDPPGSPGSAKSARPGGTAAAASPWARTGEGRSRHDRTIRVVTLIWEQTIVDA